MKTINIPLPSMDGVELKNATVDLEKGLVIAEYGEKEFSPKHGDIICLKNDPNCIFIFKEGHRKTSFIAGVTSAGLIIDKGYTLAMQGDSDVLKATPEQQQILFDALAKEGKYWDAEALEIEDIEQKILVPESVRIYRHKLPFDVFGDGLFISFNKNRQVLGSCDGLYTVNMMDDGLEKIQCYLQPCKREDLKAGDTAFFCDVELDKTVTENDVPFACKVLNDNEVVIEGLNGIAKINSEYDYWYKLIPIN